MSQTVSNETIHAPVHLWGAGPAVRAAIITTFVLSFALRLYLAAMATPAFSSDARDYRDLAQSLLSGHGYAQHYEGETEAFQGFTFRAFRSPGYPATLALLHGVCGWNDHAYLGLNIVADLVTQLCYLLVAARLFGAWPAVFVQALLGLHVLWMPNPMTESLHTALFGVLAVLLVLGTAVRSRIGTLAFGVVAAAALFVRPVTLCVYPVLGWRILRENRGAQRWLLLALAVLPAAAGVGAWTVRNYRLFGEIVPLTTNLGHHNAWDFGLHADHAFAELRARGLNEAQINDELVRIEREIAWAHPLPALVTYVQRAGQLFSLVPAWEVENLWGAVLRPENSTAGKLFHALYYQYYVTYALAAAGAVVLALRRRKLGGLWLLAGTYIILHALVSRGDIRLLAPLYPVMCVLAGGLLAVGRKSRVQA
ncbi:MAG: hypothetical protein PVJ57_21215 [Phycisphaerae bacterium]|jgi:hypothetical protein